MLTTADMCVSLRGKRILVVEEDDRLFCALTGALHEAGCETFGLLAHFPDAAATIPESHVDAALVDVEWRGTPFQMLVKRLNERNIPVLFIGPQLPVSAAGAHRAPKHLRKPFTEQQLLDGMVAIVGTPPEPIRLQSPAAEMNQRLSS
jgi:DNA-binding NtrC family response regulator